MSSIGASHDRRARAATGARRQARELKARIMPDMYTRRFTMSDDADIITGVGDGDMIACERRANPLAPAAWSTGSLWERVSA